jgi:hypothetical protein
MKPRDPAIMAAKRAEWERMTPEERAASNADALRTKPATEPTPEEPDRTDPPAGQD